MPRDKYYKILDLPLDADESDVRRRYRLLAMRYHPDKNPDPKAQEYFIQLTEAYEILVGKRELPKSPVPKAGPRQKRQATEEELRVRAKKAQVRFAEQAIRKKIEEERYFRYLTEGRKWKTIRVLSVVGLVLSIFLILDLFLPKHYEKDVVTHFDRNIAQGPSGQPLSIIKTRDGEYHWVSQLNNSIYAKSRKVYIESSWFFHNPIRIVSVEKTAYRFFNTHFTFYNATPILIAFFLVPFITMRYKRQRLTFTLLYHLSYYGTSAVILLFLLTGNRWAHILTMGFI